MNLVGVAVRVLGIAGVGYFIGQCVGDLVRGRMSACGGDCVASAGSWRGREIFRVLNGKKP